MEEAARASTTLPRASKAKGYRWEALRVLLKEVGLFEGKPDTDDDRQGEQHSKNGHGGTSVCSSQNSPFR
jgi:hypothetical protein